MKRRIVAVAVAALFILSGLPLHAQMLTDVGEIPADAEVWSSWFWPFHDDYDPNLYDADEAMARYDAYDGGAAAQSWEYQHHGPPLNPAAWWGHCHAWAAAACWEAQPSEEKILDDVTFRIRDQKGLLIEMYHHSADGLYYEIYVGLPSPGLFWRYLREEVRGDNPLHDHGMPIIGELAYGPEVWNYPIYKYHVEFSESVPHSGTITIWVADDARPEYADSDTLYSGSFTYQFQGVRGDGTNPIDSGQWIGDGPYHRPDAIWRPYPAITWTQYAGNPEIDEDHISAILSVKEPPPEENLEDADILVSRSAVDVPGNRPWVHAGLRVASGQTLRFAAGGTLIFDNDGYACGPQGATWADTRDQQDPLWQHPHGALIGKIGEQGAPFFIGAAYTVRAWSSGPLLLGVNDAWYHGNAGGFRVTITRAASTAAPPQASPVDIGPIRFPDF